MGETIVPKETFGELLRGEREHRGLEIEELAEALHAEADWLRALERNDFDSLPDERTMRECLEGYAARLDVDADLMIADYELERERVLKTRERNVAARDDDLPTPAPEDPKVAADEQPAPDDGPDEGPSERPAEPDIVETASVPTSRSAVSYSADRAPSQPASLDGYRSNEATPRRKSWLPLAVGVVIALFGMALLASRAGRQAEPVEPVDEPLPSAPKVVEQQAAVDRPTVERSAEVERPQEDTATPSETKTGDTGRIWASPPGVAPSDVPSSDEASLPEEPTARASTPVAPDRQPPPEETTRAPVRTVDVPAPDEARPPAKRLPPSVDGATLSIQEHGVGTGIVDRALRGESDRFQAGSRVWYWTRVLGGGDSVGDGDQIVHVWLRDGVEASRVRLRVGGPSWRTFSAVTLPLGRTDNWVVEARDASGAVISRREFASTP